MQEIGSIDVFMIKGEHSKAHELFGITITQNRPNISTQDNYVSIQDNRKKLPITNKMHLKKLRKNRE
jgi:hypothetical protein